MRASIWQAFYEIGIHLAIGLFLLLLTAAYSVYLIGFVVLYALLIAYIIIDKATTQIANAVSSAMEFTKRF